jgi:excinuclease ABC subunit B
MFRISSKHSPSGDQPNAIKNLVSNIDNNVRDQTLLGVTGSGKTFTIAHVIEKTQKPTIIMAHNKTLAAQLYAEMRELFPDNAVEYFVSYYDYYQPEAYIAKTDTYIEKDSLINEQIEFLRHSTTRSVLERRDVIVVSSVSSIYGLGSPEIYGNMVINAYKGMEIDISYLLKQLIKLQYNRNDIDFRRGTFRVRGDTIDIFPSYSDSTAIRLSFFGNEIDDIEEFDPLLSNVVKKFDIIKIYPNSHYATPIESIRQIIPLVQEELRDQLENLRMQGSILEAERLEQRVKYDIESLIELGSCRGIENYSRYIDGRQPGSPPSTLFSYMPQDSLLIIDESHVSVPQIRAMFAGDRARKESLVKHGFRLPSALDNRPLNFEEWDKLRPQTIYVSATPAEYELSISKNHVVRQIIRPTGLLDPLCEVRSADNQVDDIINESQDIVKRGLKILITTLTKKMAEDLHEYFNEIGIKSRYIHSDVDTMERISVIHMLRTNKIDILIGVNLLREGLDIPECELVAIMDADKEGFLRSTSALIQLIGRSARNSNGRAILYANKITKSMKEALDETNKRREIQHQYNLDNNINPKTIIKTMDNPFDSMFGDKEKSQNKKDSNNYESMDIDNLLKLIEKKQNEISKCVQNLEFEKAADIRDEINKIKTLIRSI